MAFEVHCGKCGARFTLPKDLYERKVKGRVVTVRCKKCRADISVDGTKGELPSRPEPAPDMTPTVPLAEPGALPLVVDGLWVVSFAEEDDRELTVPQIKKALEKGEISKDTLVWNTSLDEWLTLGEVPELAKLAGARDPDATGGFLGTGVRFETREPAKRSSSRPPPAETDESDLLGDDEVGPFRSVSAGTLSASDVLSAPPPRVEEAKPEKTSVERAKAEGPTAERAKAEAAKVEHAKVEHAKVEHAKVEHAKVEEGTPTVPLALVSAEPESLPPSAVELAESSRPPISNKAPPKPPRRLPSVAKVRPAWLSEPPPAEEEEDLSDGDESSPSSGTPDLRSLMKESLVPEKPSEADKDEKVSEDIFTLGGGGIAAALPTIDLTAIEPAPPSSEKKPKKKPSDEAPASDKGKKPGAKTDKRSVAPAERAEGRGKEAKAPAQKEEEKSTSPIVWVVVAAVAAAAVWWFFLRGPEPEASTRTTPSARPEPVAEPTPARTETPPAATTVAEPEPTATSAPTTAPDAASSDAAAKLAEKGEKPASESGEKPAGEKPAASAEKPAAPPGEKPTKPEASASEVSMAAPFDTAAANSALGAAAGAASGCRQEGDPSGTARVIVTFAPSGRVTTANVSGPPFAGTKTGGCIAAAMRRAKVPPFSGEMMTVSKTVTIQ